MQAIQTYMGKVTGGSTVPRIFIGGKFGGGCDEVNFQFLFFSKKERNNIYFFQVTQLHSSGKLREMLGAIGAC